MSEVLYLPHFENPNTRRSNDRSRRASASAKTKKWRIGMAPAARQLETELSPTPASAAALPDPPTASTMSSTVVSIVPYNSGRLKKSSVQNLGIENSESLIFHGVMDRFKESVAFRLRLLPGVLHQRPGELAVIGGFSPQQWSNYTRAVDPELIPPHNTIELERVFGITASYIYHGSLLTIGDSDLRRRLHQAELNPPNNKPRKPYRRRKKSRRAA